MSSVGREVMFKNLLSTLAASIGLVSAANAQDLTVGGAVVALPPGWTQLETEPERATARSPDQRQQLTVSILRLNADASFDQFKLLCAHRVAAENKAIEDGFVHADSPFESAGGFGMFFSGTDKKTGRIFSGYLSLESRELVTLYIEGLGVAPRDLSLAFQALVKGLKRK